MAFPFYTIGHSTRSIDEFVGLLNGAGARMVVDVRTVPRSPKTACLPSGPPRRTVRSHADCAKLGLLQTK